MTIATPPGPSLFDDGATVFTASSYGRVAGVAANVNLGAATSWNGVAVLNVAALKTSAGSETYTLAIQGAISSAFSSPVILATLQVATTGQYLMPVTAYSGGIFYPYLRLQLTLSGSSPSIQMQAVSGTAGGCFALPYSGLDTAPLSDLIAIYGIAAQNLQQLSNSLVAWAAGTAAGGPNGNGVYPIYDAAGDSFLAPSFAAYAASVKQGAAGPTGPQGPAGPAGTTSYTGLANLPVALALDANGNLEGTHIAVVPGGATLASLVPAQAGADVTGENLATGIFGQGPFATGTEWNYLTSLPLPLEMPNGYLRALWMEYASGALVDELMPAQALADITAENTAAAILGQGALATSALTAGQVTNSLVPVGTGNLVPYSQFERGVTASGVASGTISNPWIIGTNPATLSVSVTDTPGGGLVSLTLAATATAASQRYSLKGSYFPVASVGQLAVQCQLGTGSNTTATISVGFLNASGQVISEPNVISITSGVTFPTLEEGMVTVPTGAVKAWMEVYAGSIAAGAMSLQVGQPMVTSVPVGQTTYPPFTPGPNADNAADVTGSNTAAALLGQGLWATYSAYTPSQMAAPGANLVVNGSFKLGANYWTAQSSGPTLQAPTSPSGTGYQYGFTFSSAGFYLSQPITVTAGTVYSFQAQIYAVGITSGTARAYVTWYNSAGTALSNTNLLRVNGPGGWASLQAANVVAPAGAVTAKIGLDSSDTPGNRGRATVNGTNAVAWSQVKFEQGPTCTPFSDEATTSAMYGNGTLIDSLMPAQISADKTGANTAAAIAGQGALATLASIAWGSPLFTGTPANLAALSGIELINNALLPGVGVNRVLFSMFEAGTNAWGILYNPSGVIATLSSGSFNGAQFLKAVCVASAIGQTVSIGNKSNLFPVVAGERLCVQTRCETNNCTGQFAIGFINSSGTAISEPQIGSVPAGTTYGTQVQGFVTVPAGAVTAWVEFYGTSTVASGTFFFDIQQPMVSGAISTQTGYPSFNPGPNAYAAADVTSGHTAAGIAGQGALATLSAIAWVSSFLTGMPANLASLIGTEVINNAILQAALIGGSIVPASAALASSISGQSPWATYSGYTPAQVTQVGNNLLYNGDCTLGTDGWTKAGTGVLQQNICNGPNNQAYILATANGIWYNDTPVTPGTPYSFQGNINSHGLSAGLVRIVIEWYDSTKTNNISTTNVGFLAAGNNWTQYTLPNQVAPAGAAYGRILIDTAGSGTGNPEQAATFNGGPVGWSQMKMEQGAACTPMSAQSTTGALYPGGAPISLLQPAQAGSDKTSANIASGFAGQGSLATLSSLAWASSLFTGIPAALTQLNASGTLFASNVGYDNSTPLSALRPAQVGADKTGSNTAAAFAGQSAWATYSSYTPGQVMTPGANLVNNGGFAQQLNCWSPSASGVFGWGTNGVNSTPFVYTNNTGQFEIFSLFMPVIPSTPYSLQGWSYTAGMVAGTGYAQICVTWYTSAQVYITENDISFPAGASWVYKALANQVSPANAAYAVIQLRTVNSAANLIGGSTWNGAATLAAWGQVKLEIGSSCTPFNNWGDTSAMYSSGSTLDSLMPAQISADRTGGNIAAGFAGQGGFSTISTLTAMAQMPYNMQQGVGYVFSQTVSMTADNGVITITSGTLYMTGGGTIGWPNGSLSVAMGFNYAVFYNPSTNAYTALASGTSGYYTSPQGWVNLGIVNVSGSSNLTLYGGGNTGRGNICQP